MFAFFRFGGDFSRSDMLKYYEKNSNDLEKSQPIVYSMRFDLHIKIKSIL